MQAWRTSKFTHGITHGINLGGGATAHTWHDCVLQSATNGDEIDPWMDDIVSMYDESGEGEAPNDSN